MDYIDTTITNCRYIVISDPSKLLKILEWRTEILYIFNVLLKGASVKGTKGIYYRKTKLSSARRTTTPPSIDSITHIARIDRVCHNINPSLEGGRLEESEVRHADSVKRDLGVDPLRVIL